MVLTKEKTNCILSVVHVYICMTITLMDPRTDSMVQKNKKQIIVCYGGSLVQVGVNFAFYIEANCSPHTV